MTKNENEKRTRCRRRIGTSMRDRGRTVRVEMESQRLAVGEDKVVLL